MRDKGYYSIRTGKNPNAVHFDMPILLRLFYDLYQAYAEDCYFQQAFGYYCIDNGEVFGTLGSNISAKIFRKLRKENLWPVLEKYENYSEDDVFDMIEFLYDSVSKPLEEDGYYHSFNDCGWHYKKFDIEAGRLEFRIEVNDILRDYKEGYELSETGEILALPESGLENLVEAGLPAYDPNNVEKRMEEAKLKFRRYRSSLDDKRDAVRSLADVLEFLRPKLSLVITRKDEGDLFNIANNFGVRHHNDTQKTDYDAAIWYSWMFYYYLATIHAAVRLIKKSEQNPSFPD
jgi:hypothetical protein